ncbi:hypothetical protein LR48_Vigan10g221500 [Vigna angularis]|uniref:Uncharacterized protein n=1 Tax=Phaseolus angularis TaxID=3914 RepID=A0A0L9VMY8_PHAAN|nr:hypothetical protein LR48_Vigan10g221500 [Vigna angularis]
MTERLTKVLLPIGQISKGKGSDRTVTSYTTTTTIERPTVRPSLPHLRGSRPPELLLPAPLQVARFHLLTSTRMIIAKQDRRTTGQQDSVNSIPYSHNDLSTWFKTESNKGQLAANYTTSRGGTLKHQPSSSTTAPDEVVLRLTQALEQRDQEITDMRAEFTNFKALVMRVLPETSQDVQNIPPTQPRPSSSPAAAQQPISVQPTPVQPSIEEHDDEDHSDDNYVHY